MKPCNNSIALALLFFAHAMLWGGTAIIQFHSLASSSCANLPFNLKVTACESSNRHHEYAQHATYQQQAYQLEQWDRLKETIAASRHDFQATLSSKPLQTAVEKQNARTS